MAFEIDTHDDEFVMDDDFEDQTKIMVIGAAAAAETQSAIWSRGI